MYLFLFSSFLGMHTNISLSYWWKWPCSNDGNGPQLAAPVQCIISLNEFAPVPAHQPSPAPSKGQAVPQLWDWKQIEGGCWTVLRVLGFVKTWYLVKCIFCLIQLLWEGYFLILLQEDSLLHLFTIPSEVWQFYPLFSIFPLPAPLFTRFSHSIEYWSTVAQ